MGHGRDCIVLNWLLAATRAGELVWFRNEDDWYVTQFAGQVICFRVQSILITDPIRPEEYVIDLHMPGLSTGFGCGTQGWYILQDVIASIEGAPGNQIDSKAFLDAHFPPVDPELEAKIPLHYRIEHDLLNRFHRRQVEWEDASEHGWYETKMGGRECLMRFRYFESLREVSAKPRMIELSVPGWNAGFFCGTYGWATCWYMFSCSRDEIIVPSESINDFFKKHSLPRPGFEPPAQYFEDVRALERLLYATIHRQIEWTEHESLWHTCQIGDQTISICSYWIASMNQIGADPYLIDFEIGNHKVRFTPGTWGFELAMQIRQEINQVDPRQWDFAWVEKFFDKHLSGDPD